MIDLTILIFFTIILFVMIGTEIFKITNRLKLRESKIRDDKTSKYRRIKTYKEGGFIPNIYDPPLVITTKPIKEIEVEHKPMIDFKDIPFWEVGKVSIVKEVEKISIISSKPTPGLFITDKYRNIPELNRMKEHIKNGNIL